MKEESEPDDTEILRLYIDDDEVKSINSDRGLFADNGLFDSMIKYHCICWSLQKYFKRIQF